VTSVREPGLPTIDTYGEDYQRDWHAVHRAVLADGPVAMGTFGPVLLGYAEVQAALRDRRLRSPAGLGLSLQGITDGPLWDRVVKGILSLDGDEHTRLRRLVAQAFTPREADRLRGAMRRIVDELVDAVAPAGACDVVADVARSYPTRVVCELFGAPPEDWPALSDWTDDIFRIFSMEVAAHEQDILDAFEAVDAYVDGLVAARREHLGDDLLSNLVRAEDAGDRLTHDEMQMLSGAVLSAGTDTTRNQLGAAVEVFCDHPEQWRLLAEQPELAARAVDEVMRYAPIILGTVRVADADVEIAGVAIPEGSFVEVVTSAANRDPAVYPDPDTFDITREGPAPQLTFGGGIHFCLGVHLAKAELAEALAIMSRRMPDLRRAGASPWKSVVGIAGPTTLPVTFSAGR